MVTKVKAAGVDGGLLRRLLPGGRPDPQAAHAPPGSRRRWSPATASTTPAYITAAGQAAAEGTILTCPCAAGRRGPGHLRRPTTRRLNGTDPGTYSDTAYDAANILLAGIKAGKTTRADLLEFVKGYSGERCRRRATSSPPTGELDPAQVKVWAFKVNGGKVVPDQEIPKVLISVAATAIAQ